MDWREELLKEVGGNRSFTANQTKNLCVIAELYLDALVEDLRNIRPGMTKEMLILQKIRDSDDCSKKIAMMLIGFNREDKIEGK